MLGWKISASLMQSAPNTLEFKDRTIWEVFQDERPRLMELRGPFDGFVEKAVRASTTCLIMADHNRYSVDAPRRWPDGTRAPHAERIVVLLDGEVVADHPRQFRRDQIIYDPWHYLPVLVKKPGRALRNGAPFKEWSLSTALAQVRAKLERAIPMGIASSSRCWARCSITAWPLSRRPAPRRCRPASPMAM